MRARRCVVSLVWSVLAIGAASFLPPLQAQLADSGGGVDNLANSYVVVNPKEVELQAARNGGGAGRTYSVEISCKDNDPRRFLSRPHHVHPPAAWNPYGCRSGT